MHNITLNYNKKHNIMSKISDSFVNEEEVNRIIKEINNPENPGWSLIKYETQVNKMCKINIELWLEDKVLDVIRVESHPRDASKLIAIIPHASGSGRPTQQAIDKAIAQKHNQWLRQDTL